MCATWNNKLKDLAIKYTLDPADWPACNVVLAHLESARHDMQLDVAFRWAAHFLTVPNISDAAWKWIINQAEEADAQCQCALSIAVFELLMDESPWVQKLFSLLANPRLWWIFVDMYEKQPEQFYRSFRKVAEGNSERRFSHG